MKIIDKIRYRALHKALERFTEIKGLVKLPNMLKVSSVTIILEERDKTILKNLESTVKNLFGASRCGFIVLCDQISDNILQSDLYTEITPKDFGFMSVLKSEKQEYLKKLPSSNIIVNMATNLTDISDYLCILPKSDFRVSFRQSEHIKIYDLVIENSKNADPVSNIQVLHNYLTALAGNPK